MTRAFYTEFLPPVRAGRPVKRLLSAVLKEEKKTNHKATRSDIVRRAIIRDARRVLGSKADEILLKGIEIGGKR